MTRWATLVAFGGWLAAFVRDAESIRGGRNWCVARSFRRRLVLGRQGTVSGVASWRSRRAASLFKGPGVVADEQSFSLEAASVIVGRHRIFLSHWRRRRRRRGTRLGRQSLALMVVFKVVIVEKIGRLRSRILVTPCGAKISVDFL